MRLMIYMRGSHFATTRPFVVYAIAQDGSGVPIYPTNLGFQTMHANGVQHNFNVFEGKIKLKPHEKIFNIFLEIG